VDLQNKVPPLPPNGPNLGPLRLNGQEIEADRQGTVQRLEEENFEEKVQEYVKSFRGKRRCPEIPKGEVQALS
jgi:hypothetical protein